MERKSSSRGLMITTLLAGMLGLASCSPSPWVHLPSQKKTFRVLEVDPPKRLFVTIQDVQNGATYERIYVAKRCSSYARVPVGTELLITLDVWENSRTKAIAAEPNVDELRGWFCG